MQILVAYEWEEMPGKWGSSTYDEIAGYKTLAAGESYTITKPQGMGFGRVALAVSDASGTSQTTYDFLMTKDSVVRANYAKAPFEDIRVKPPGGGDNWEFGNRYTTVVGWLKGGQETPVPTPGPPI